MQDYRMMSPYEQFGDLKKQYSDPKFYAFREAIIESMRLNLLNRNDGKEEIALYPTNDVVHIRTAEQEALYAADATLHHYNM